ncbi:MAG: glycerol-3-phosphate acyltransferase [Gammaproteobacteria bacterium]|nr:glycerol-3-phosphate acyltransferase [Gammaproteobacteria bacterium]MBT3859467.1 glycerol-3-phosphate acyltransferase [Gammaproteobacteria bacterium]MBT3986646.1 glycerol-3-phosphate acyltransferase [Gammaproteobacteria bacterium]MBT4580985.1 glycerol-3-phosphate acyltransferase [Gammaproteobacteria bacterium]MBT4658381.1 glycerol-3-phosphate acyltransferase [Gammaproteobacteria bacterium]
MFSSTVSIPTWVFLLLLAAASYAVVMSILFPGARWFLRRRLNRAVDRINASLQIEIRPLQRTKRQVLIDQLMFDQEILALIEAQSEQDDIPREVLQDKVKSYAREIVPSFNAYVYYQVFYWLAKKVSRFIYRVRVAAADQKELQSVDPEATVVFVMNHRSNMDYVLISYLAAERVTLSYAVGEWARIFPLEMLIRAMGAFFVRRGSQNPLYRKVLERYVYMATQSGVCQAVFLEGGLSRDGLMGEPKLGFLDYMLRNYDSQTDRNIVFVPVGINYDQVLEDQNLLNWDNKEKKLSKLQHLGKLWRFLKNNLFAGSRKRWKRFGYASVNFGMPVSMQRYCSSKEIDFKHLGKEKRIEKVAELAELLMDAVRYVVPVLPVPTISAVLIRAGEQSLTSLEIVSGCDELIDEMIERGAAMKVEDKPRHRTLSRSLDLLRQRGLIVEKDDRYQINPQQRRVLEYYANSIEHLWKQEDPA